MPNICTTNYVIEGKKEELDALYQKMKELQEMEQPLVENSFGPTWLGCLVKALGKNPDDVMCRGQWIELEQIKILIFIDVIHQIVVQPFPFDKHHFQFCFLFLR